MTKISKSVLDQLKKQSVKPIGRSVFLFKNILIWLAVVAFILLLSLGIGVIISAVLQAHWDDLSRWPGGHFGLLRDTVRLAWIVIILVAILGAMLFFYHTKKGYRYGILGVSMVLISSTLFTGFLLTHTPLPEKVRQWHHLQLPPNFSVSRFHAPKKGRMVGHFLEINFYEDDTATFETIDGKKWTVWILNSDIDPFTNQLQILFGEPIDDDIFATLRAEKIPDYFFLQEIPRDIRMR